MLKKLLIKIILVMLAIIMISIISLSILGRKERIGYLDNITLNTEETLKINNIIYTNIIYTNKNNNEVKSRIIINNTNEFILEQDVVNFIINDSKEITNHIYKFKISYYSKVFKNSDIYGVYPNTNKFLEEYEDIKEIKMDEEGSPFGKIVTIKNTYCINNNSYKISYNLKIRKLDTIFQIVMVLIIIIITLISFYFYKVFFIKIKKLPETEYLFVLNIIYIAIVLFLFQFILVYPGYFQFNDILGSMLEGLRFSGANNQPRIIGIFLGILYRIFGYHTYYILFINLFMWYFSISIIIISLYIKYKNKYLILLFLISYIGNIFFMNINHLRDTTATLFVFTAYSIMFTTLYHNYSNRNNIYIHIISFILIIIGMLWRHNFIVTVYPFSLFYITKIMSNIKNISIKKYSLYFTSMMIVMAIILISIYKLFPIITNSITDKKYSTTHIFLLQIAACAVPNNDDSFIPKEWYEDGKNFNDVIKVYNNNSLYADYLSVPWYDDRPFKPYNLANLKTIWIKYILKYPISYIKHMLKFSYSMYTANMYWKLDSNTFQRKNLYNEIIPEEYSQLLAPTSIILSPLQKRIYNFLYKILKEIKIIIFIILSYVIFFINIYFIFIKKIRNNINLFSFYTSSSAVATAIIVAVFSPIIDYRYIYPVIPITIIALISFITFLYDEIIAKNKN